MFSGMWRSDETHIALPPIYGPPHVPSASELEQALIALRDYICELCIPDLKRASIAHRTERDSELEHIADRFILKGREAVVEFLRQHRSLVPVLAEAREKFDQYFGIAEFTRPRLEVFIEPQGEDSEPSLFALVPTTLPFKEAVTRLDRLDEDWWFDQPSEVRCLMNIDVEYVNAPTI